MSIHTLKYESKTIHLIDTPGFNDSTRTESEVLQELTYWLSTAYGTAQTEPTARFRLDGIIYLHSIADTRWGGSTSRSFNLLRHLTGPDAYDAIILATTFWDQVDRATGNSRESQLINDTNKWGQVLSKHPKSATVRRHDRLYQSAMSMIKFIASRNIKYDLLIQKELILPNATLQQTTAGRIAQQLWEQDIARFEAEVAQARQSVADSAQQSGVAIGDDVQALRASISSRRDQLEDLRLTKERLALLWEDKNKRDVELLQQKLDDCHSKIEALVTKAQSAVSEQRSSTLASHATPVYAVQAAASYEQQVMAEVRRREKDLMLQKQAKIAARSMNASVAGALFGGISALCACSVM